MLSVAAMFEANLMESTCLGRSGMAVTAAAEPRSGTRACRKVSPRWRRQKRPRERVTAVAALRPEEED